MLVSGVQRSDSVLRIHTCSSTLFQILFQYRLLQANEYSSLCYTVGPCCLSISYIVVCISEKAMATHSSTLAWKIPWTEEPGRLKSMGSLGVGHDWATSLSLWCIGEGNGNPLQCSCLENPRDRGACWAAVCGGKAVTQSWTRLKRLSRIAAVCIC